MTDYLERKINHNDSNLASCFDELSFWSSRFGVFLFRHLEMVRGIHVLDIGCGTGFPLFELAQCHGKTCQFIGVDIWKEAIDRAALKQRTYELENVRLLRADGAFLPFLNAQFDLIISHLGVNNFSDQRAVLSECARVAKPQARIVLTTNVKGHMQEFYDVYREILIGFGKAEYLKRLTLNENHRAGKELLCALLEESGFCLTRIIEDRFHLHYLDGSALLRHFLTRFGFLEGWRSVVDSLDEGPVFSAVEEKLNELANRTGELKLTGPMLYLEGRRG